MPDRDELKDELENRWDDLGEFIRDQRRVGHLSLRKLSELAGHLEPVPEPDRAGPAQAVGGDPPADRPGARRSRAETLYIRAGILEERTGTADLVGEILRDPYLTEDQKKTLVRIYESFRHENGNARGADQAGSPRGMRGPG